jgi:hypothetical protein
MLSKENRFKLGLSFSVEDLNQIGSHIEEDIKEIFENFFQEKFQKEDYSKLDLMSEKLIREILEDHYVFERLHEACIHIIILKKELTSDFRKKVIERAREKGIDFKNFEDLLTKTQEYLIAFFYLLGFVLSGIRGAYRHFFSEKEFKENKELLEKRLKNIKRSFLEEV